MVMPISIHAPREGSDALRARPFGPGCYFYPRSPRGERRTEVQHGIADGDISIHAPREGSDLVCRQRRRTGQYFYPRSPRGERQTAFKKKAPRSNFYPRSPRGERLRGLAGGPAGRPISIHAPREGSDLKDAVAETTDALISIHAPREGSDGSRTCGAAARTYFYPRSPRGERRQGQLARRCGLVQFLSTLPARGATQILPRERPDQGDFYPRSPRGERRGNAYNADDVTLFLSTLPARGATCLLAVSCSALWVISIHAPREGSDLVHHGLPVEHGISIHAPREGSDVEISFVVLVHLNISIHAPREGSDYRTAVYNTTAELFLSTLPARGATRSGAERHQRRCNFYPRSPRGERRERRLILRFEKDFYPRSPRGERLQKPLQRDAGRAISIHAPREGGDRRWAPKRCCRW